jgi:O-antigen/teichoic acid export membrane protein
VLLLLTPTVILWSANNATAGVVIGIGKHKPIVPVLLAEGLSNLLLSALWVRHYGILGVALGTSIPNLASSLFFWPWYAKRTLAVPTRLYIMSGWIRPAIGIVPFALITLAFERLSPASNLLIFFLQVAAAMPTALLGFWFLCFSSAERDLYLRKLTNVVGRFVSRR